MRLTWRYLAIAGVAFLLGGCQAVHRDLHRSDPRLNRGSIDTGKNARCSPIAQLFRPDVVRSVRGGVPFVASGSYYYSESNVRVTEDLLVTVNQVLLQACIQRELGEISAEEYTRVYRDNSARFIALARGYSATPSPAEAAAVMEGAEAGPDGDADSLSRSIESLVEDLTQALGTEKDRAQEEMRRLRREVAEEMARLRERPSVLNPLTAGSAASGAATRPAEEGSVRTAGRLSGMFLLFDTGQASIDRAGRDRLLAFARATCCGRRYVVYGFADATGPTDANLALSRIRALRVAEALRAQVGNAAIVEVALGETSGLGPDLRDNRLVYVVATAAADWPDRDTTMQPPR